ncbi:MAG TPA: hypothetical protein VGL80_27195 [Pseudonocardiaceae bacterium]
MSDVVAHVERAFVTDLDSTTEVAKRRSLGFRTDRGTWVRIEVKDVARLHGQSWGVEAAARLTGVAMPAWHQGISWLDHDRQVMWRADEMDYISDPPIKAGGTLTVEPRLSDQWWATFNASLDALGAHTTTRTATLSGETVTQLRLAGTIHRVFPDVHATINEWTVAHADLGWANLTAPTCYFLDWEDWGTAPRGWDAAMLWSQSLAVPALAERVATERTADLASRSGKLTQLFHCAGLIAAGAGYAGQLFEPVQAAAARLLIDLR